MDIDDEKKKKYLDLIKEIKKEDDKKTREFLFHQLVKIVNKTGKAFDWSAITKSNYSQEPFETGVIIHQAGNIKVVKE